jgi:hypothetical protein
LYETIKHQYRDWNKVGEELICERLPIIVDLSESAESDHALVTLSANMKGSGPLDVARGLAGLHSLYALIQSRGYTGKFNLHSAQVAEYTISVNVKSCDDLEKLLEDLTL